MKLGSKHDNARLTERANQNLQATTDLFKQTFTLIKDFKEFNFPSNHDKVKNLSSVRLMESQANKMKQEFEEITQKINKQNTQLVISRKNSRLNSVMSVNPIQQTVHGRDILDEDTILKEKQIPLIEK